MRDAPDVFDIEPSRLRKPSALALRLSFRPRKFAKEFARLGGIGSVCKRRIVEVAQMNLASPHRFAVARQRPALFDHETPLLEPTLVGGEQSLCSPDSEYPLARPQITYPIIQSVTVAMVNLFGINSEDV